MQLFTIILLLLLLLPLTTTGFVNNNNNNGRKPPPPRGPPTLRHGAGDSGESFVDLTASNIAHFKRWNDTSHLDHDDDDDDDDDDDANNDIDELIGNARGGSQQPVTDVVKGTQATLSATTSFWGQTFGRVIQNVKASVTKIGGKVSKRFQSPEKRKEEELLQQLRTMPVQRVVVQNSQVLPKEVVQIATRRADMLGKPLGTERVQELARTLKQWYDRQGYVLHSVTGATLETTTATAEIQVQEPVSAQQPVDIIFCKEMAIDPDTGALMTMRQYKDRYAVKQRFGAIRKSGEPMQVNTTFIETEGRTKPNRIASALGLRSNRPFQWKPQRWQNIVNSGIFTRVVRATPQPMEDGGIQLQIVAQEAPTRHLEYGLGKSLYTGSWEGELDFEHSNLIGGGEVLAVSVRRGTKDVEPSIRVRFTDDHFGMEGGYDIEAFSDYVGDLTHEEPGEQPGEVTMKVADINDGSMDSSPAISEPSSGATANVADASDTNMGTVQSPQNKVDYDHDDLLSRRGATFRLRNPFNPEVIRNSMVSASIERTYSKTGLHENIGSTTLQLGPFRRQLPMHAMSSIDTSVTTGARILDFASSYSNEKRDGPNSMKPYASFSATTKQVVPVLETRTAGNRPLILALRHSATVSSSNLPRHEAKAHGVANNVRGAKSNGHVSSAIRGTTEVRIPIDIPMLSSREQDANVVLFGDWLFATKDSTSPIFRKSSVGIGFRKNLQGLPLHCNLCYAGDGKIKTLFGLGRDFEA